MAFIDRLQPAPRSGGFRMQDYWVWCGSPIHGDDGNYHLFAARWPKSLPFFAGYKVRSEIVRAVSPTPEGPYIFAQVVLPERGASFWDGRMTHNPTIHKWGNTYLLYYIGATYKGPPPDEQSLRAGSAQADESYASIRIGLATATSVLGPWTRSDAPILEPRPGHWDSSVVTNPAACVLDDGRVLLVYRSNTPDGLRLGAALAQQPEGPYQRAQEAPILVFEGGNHVEDPYIWHTGERFELLAKDLTGGLTGEVHAGVHAWSLDGLSWRLGSPVKAYSRRIAWDDGTTSVQGSFERPQLLIQNRQPTHLFAATGNGPGGFRNATETWNMVIPLKPDHPG